MTTPTARPAGLSGPEAVPALARRHGRLRTFWQLAHYRRGRPLWVQDWTPNGLTSAGQTNILDVYFTDRNAPAGFYLGLGTNPDSGTAFPPLLEDYDRLDNIDELTGTGYARIAVARAITTGFVVVDYYLTTVEKTFAAGGTWTPARFAFLCDVASGTTGRLICTTPLSVERTLLDGDQLQVSIAVALD